MLTANAFTITSFGKCPIDVDELLNQNHGGGRRLLDTDPTPPVGRNKRANAHNTKRTDAKANA